MLGAILIPLEVGTANSADIQRATVALEPLCSRVLVFGGGAASGAADHPLPDDASDLAAVTEAIKHAGDDHVAVLASDLLHLSAELLRYMQYVRSSFEAVVPQYNDGSLQPLLAIYHGSLLRRAEGLLAAGEQDLSALLELATIRRISVEEVAKFGEPPRLLKRAGALRVPCSTQRAGESP